MRIVHRELPFARPADRHPRGTRQQRRYQRWAARFDDSEGSLRPAPPEKTGSGCNLHCSSFEPRRPEPVTKRQPQQISAGNENGDDCADCVTQK